MKLMKIITKMRKSLHRYVYCIRRTISSLRLHKIDNLNIPDLQDEIRLFVIAKDEMLRLQYFFKYYFDKGVDRIFLIDNDSSDGTLSYALSHKNVHVFHTKENFGKRECWMETLLNRYGKNHWCLVVDVDEIFNYPYSNILSIKKLCGFLDRKKHTSLQCLLLDMYSNKSLKLISYKGGEDPIVVCPYFDVNYYAKTCSRLNRYAFRAFDFKLFYGGMRERVFGVNACLSKISLFKYTDNVYLDRSMHAIDGVRMSDIQGVTFHFKYLQDFPSRVIEEAKRGAHWNNAIEYKLYTKKIREDSRLNLLYEGSVKFKDNNQLINLGLMKCSESLHKYSSNILRD